MAATRGTGDTRNQRAVTRVQNQPMRARVARAAAGRRGQGRSRARRELTAGPGVVDWGVARREKPAVVEALGRQVRRVAVRTRVLDRGDDLVAELRKYCGQVLAAGDVLTIAESAVACVQGRAVPVSDIRPGFWASVLWRFVKRVPYGIGLRSPWSMQCAIDEVGAPRILRASIAGAWGKLRGRSGDFYRVAGDQAKMIDAAHTSGVKEFYECVILGPKDPEGVAGQLALALGCPVAIVDANDIFGCAVVGASAGVDRGLVEAAMRDNPAGQGDELTPVVLLRVEGGGGGRGADDVGGEVSGVRGAESTTAGPPAGSRRAG